MVPFYKNITRAIYIQLYVDCVRILEYHVNINKECGLYINILDFMDVMFYWYDTKTCKHYGKFDTKLIVINMINAKTSMEKVVQKYYMYNLHLLIC